MHHGSNVFVALGDELGAGKWSVRFQIRPLVNFLWLGAFIMAVGGAIAATDRRYRVAREAVTTVPVATPGVAGGASHATPGQFREECPGPTLSGRMPAQEEAG
jgi:hypothetical protein